MSGFDKEAKENSRIVKLSWKILNAAGDSASPEAVSIYMQIKKTLRRLVSEENAKNNFTSLMTLSRLPTRQVGSLRAGGVMRAPPPHTGYLSLLSTTQVKSSLIQWMY